MKIEKEISTESPTIKLLYGNISIRKLQYICEIYLNKLDFKFLKFAMPSILASNENSIVFEQDYIRGVTIKDYISNSKQYATFKHLFNNLLKDVIEFNKTEFCLDLNLCNFILSNDSVYLIDFLPPICLNFVKKNYSNNYMGRLFCDKKYGLIAMLYYYIKGISINSNIDIDIKSKVIIDIIDDFKNEVDCSELKIDIEPFGLYLKHIFEYLQNKSDKSLRVIKNDSFLRFLEGHQKI